MENSPEKITIRPEDLNRPPPRPLRISESDLPPEASLKPAHEAPLEAILVDDAQDSESSPASPASPTASESLPRVAWIGLTLIPFLNAWIWWRYAPDEPERRSLFRTAACLLGAASVLFVIGVVFFFAWPEIDWIEQTASRADRSVVLIQSRPDSLGTGFVIASRGNEHLILTNRHVVTDPEQCLVSLRLGSVVPAEVVGYPKNDDLDLALLVAKAPGLRSMGRIARFNDVRVGEAVVAIGHPLGLDYTVTSGIVSAKRNSREIQTSAPISPGNSGGPLVNKHGFVLGVNTRTVEATEGQALSFATRADVVLNADAWRFERDVDDLLSRIQR
jgi:S1-C subfamily serine protease